MELSKEQREEVHKLLDVLYWEQDSDAEALFCELIAERDRLKAELEEAKNEIDNSRYNIRCYHNMCDRIWKAIGNKFDGISPCDVLLINELAAAKARIAELEAEVTKWQRIRTPDHGPCCTCQRCGMDYANCRCDLDEVVDELAEAKAIIRELWNSTRAPADTNITPGVHERDARRRAMVEKILGKDGYGDE